MVPPPRINTEEPDSSDLLSSDSSTSTAGSSSTIRPSGLLAPAAINISPPSPIDATSSPFRSPTRISSSPGRLSLDVSSSSSSSSPGGPYAANEFSLSPMGDSSLLVPESPDTRPADDLSRSSSDASSSSHTSQTPSGSHAHQHHHPLVRTHSPSSPHYRPKGLHHRRTSSTHRVKESEGQTRNDEDGARLVNQYKIGKSLGQGAYAKVELAIDLQSGEEYVSQVESPLFLSDVSKLIRLGDQGILQVETTLSISAREEPTECAESATQKSQSSDSPKPR